jgi:hypothetical protein
MDAVITDTAPAAVEQTNTSTPGSEGGAAIPAAASASPGTGTPPSRSYTQEDVERIIRTRVAEQKGSFDKRFADLQKQLQERDAILQRASAGIDGMARGFGFVKDEAPQYVTMDQLHSLKEETLREQQTAFLRNKAESDWEKVNAKHPSYAKLPGFKHAFLEQWGQNPMGGAELADAIAEQYSAFEKATVEARMKEYAEKKAATQTAVVPSGKGAVATPSAEKGSLQARIKARLTAAQG